MLSEYEQRVLAAIEIDLVAQGQELLTRRRRRLRSIAVSAAVALGALFVGLAVGLSAPVAVGVIGGVMFGSSLTLGIVSIGMTRWISVSRAVRHPHRPRMPRVRGRRTTA
jgi:hypothetical protein